MKPVKLLFVTAVLLLMCALLACVEAENAVPGAFLLPESLQMIEDSAFEGTAASVVWIPESAVYIGDRAFAETPLLKKIYIPGSTEFIGENAFAGTRRLVIYGVGGSYAEEWAKRHGFRFVRYDIWLAVSRINGQGRQITRYPSLFQRLGVGAAREWRAGRHVERGFSLNPKQRPEMPPIDYDFP